MPFGLLTFGLSKKYPDKHHFTPATALKKQYHVVIIGADGFSGELIGVAAPKILA